MAWCRSIAILAASPVGWMAIGATCLFAANVAAGPPSVRIDEEVCYAVRGEQRLLLNVYQPASQAAPDRPARRGVVLVHGGGWYTGSRYASTMVNLAQALSAQGFVAFSIDYRLVQDAPRSNEIVNAFPAALDDCQEAVRWIRAHADQYELDASALGAAGDSAGGNLVSLLGSCDTRDPDGPWPTFSSRVQAVVNLYGPTDLTVDFSTQTLAGGTVQQMVDRWLPNVDKRREASPRYLITPTTAPILLFHGARDPLIAIEQSRAFQHALREAGRTVELVEFADQKHGFSPERQQEVAARAVLFFRKWLR